MMILKRWFPLLAVVMTLFVLTWTEETTRGGNDRGGGKEFTTRPRDFDEKDSSFSGKDVLSSFTSSSLSLIHIYEPTRPMNIAFAVLWV